VSVTIKRLYGSPNDGWDWDGSVLKPYYGARSDGWEADGPVPILVWAAILGIIRK